MENEQKLNHINPIIWFIFLFNIFWICGQILFVEYIHILGDPASVLLNAGIKIIVYVFSALLYIKFVLNREPLQYLKLNQHIRKGLFYGIGLSLLLGLYFTYQSGRLASGNFDFTLSFDDYLNVFLLAGITEEIVFRGLILQEINKKISFWKANLITSFLFLIIHFPTWMLTGVFSNFWAHIYVFSGGLVFGFLFKKTNSLWTVIILHSFHNLFVSIM